LANVREGFFFQFNQFNQLQLAVGDLGVSIPTSTMHPSPNQQRAMAGACDNALHVRTRRT
jgi:hypothetical protein